jgi:DtxR family Mn-dependent transcriptional regulator
LSVLTELSPQAGDYLKTVYRLSATGDAAATTAIADLLRVSPAAATNMMKRLARAGFVTHRSYQGVRLTESGTRAALELIRHHRLLESFLHSVMGYPLDRVHEEAERLEHHISEAFEERIAERLGHPTHDPHGDPIPGRDGSIPATETLPLEACPAGREVRIARVSDNDSGTLHRIEKVGLVPGVVIAVGAVESNGTRIVRCGRRRIALDPDMVAAISVSSQ